MWCHGSETGSVESAPRTNWKTALQAVSARSRTLAIRFTVKRVSHLPARNFLVVPSHQSRAITSTCYWFFFWFFFFKVDRFYKAFLYKSLFSNRLTVLLWRVIFSQCLPFSARFWISTQVVYLQQCLVVTWLVPRETADVSARSVYPIHPCMSRHVIQSHISRVHACLAVTCHLHFWQNLPPELSAVTWG